MKEPPKTEYPASTKYYNEHVAEISQQYNSVSFNDVHSSWSRSLPNMLSKPNVSVLDVGAGTGRDISDLYRQAVSTLKDEAKLGQFVAVEPSEQLRNLGQQLTQYQDIKWLDDSLPSLAKTYSLEVSFDLILLSAVWMHVAPSDRARAIRKLANLLKPGGKIAISLRYGQTEQDLRERKMYNVCADELKKLASEVGLFCKLETPIEPDKNGRKHLSWQTLVLQLPDDGTGAFPFIRHVAINDGKSATHKLALLRVLLRIADGHPGAVIRREPSVFGDRVILPVGLVALYWCHQYKDLIDQHSLFQTPNNQPNMGFMKADGWHKLTHRAASDYRIGNFFSGEDAIALYKTISASVLNIKEMPCRYIKLPNSDRTVFEVDNKTVRAKDSIFLDMPTLEQWGEFSLPESTWIAFNRYACWIEPVLISEWVKTMATYKGNVVYKDAKNHHHLYRALNWLEPKRTTQEVRQRFEELKHDHDMQCVWSAKRINRRYDIDHSIPFARWPNNDLWNLLPTDSNINNQKRDKLPTELKLKNAKSRITDWWKEAWLKDNAAHQQHRFFAEANIALPGLNSSNNSIDDLFEALVIQRSRLREMQQLKEW